ncbi:MAG: hypothetical protein ACK5IB_11940 [Qingshengfaniella sp.]
MSQTDSFIEEVSAEVRRDRLYTYARRYGWIAVLAVLVLVGGAAYLEWRKAQDTAQAQALGDAMLGAMAGETANTRAVALAEVSATGEAEALRLLLLAGEQAGIDAEAAGAALQQVQAMAEIRPIYRDLATLRLTMLADYPMFSEARLAALDPLTVPGAPLRLTALEQTAYIQTERGEIVEAIATLRRIFQDAEASIAQRQRVGEMIVALGGDPVEG